jgi:2'-5' RNA ligase
MLNSDDGVIMSFRGVGFGDEAVWTKMHLGASSVQVLRELIEDEADPYLTDGRFMPHLTVYRKCATNEETRRSVEASVQEMKLGCILVEKVTLRERKKGPEIKEPIKTWYLCKSNK